MKQSKIAIVGPGASGKDYLRQKFQDRGFRFGISCTTRPPRTGEKNGRDYYFLTEEQFDQLVNDGHMVEWQEFNNWKYGLSVTEWEKCDIMILNAEAVEMLEPKYRNNLFVMYMDIDRETRLERLLKRKDYQDADDPYRRIEEDDKQFRNFSDFDCKITNEDF